MVILKKIINLKNNYRQNYNLLNQYGERKKKEKENQRYAKTSLLIILLWSLA
jgi:hypothetical protein